MSLQETHCTIGASFHPLLVSELPGKPTSQVQTPHGLALLYKSHLAVKLVYALPYDVSCRLEAALWSVQSAEVELLVCGVYAPPGLAVKHVLDLVTDILHRAGDVPTVIMGDFNIDLNKHQGRAFAATMEEAGLGRSQTGFTTRRRSTLDHVWSAAAFPAVETHVGCCSYSDHLPLYGYIA